MRTHICLDMSLENDSTGQAMQIGLTGDDENVHGSNKTFPKHCFEEVLEVVEQRRALVLVGEFVGTNEVVEVEPISTFVDVGGSAIRDPTENEADDMRSFDDRVGQEDFWRGLGRLIEVSYHTSKYDTAAQHE